MPGRSTDGKRKTKFHRGSNENRRRSRGGCRSGFESAPLARRCRFDWRRRGVLCGEETARAVVRSEEHTSELQSHLNLVCRLLLEKKKKKSRSLRSMTDGEG